MTDDVVMTFDPPAEPLSMNDKDNRASGRSKQAWRDAAYFHWCRIHPGVGPSDRAAPTPSVVHVVLPFDVRRRRDPINFARTVKAIVDGMRMAGAWPDDTSDYVTQELPTLTVGAKLPVVVRVSPRAGTSRDAATSPG